MARKKRLRRQKRTLGMRPVDSAWQDGVDRYRARSKGRSLEGVEDEGRNLETVVTIEDMFNQHLIKQAEIEDKEEEGSYVESGSRYVFLGNEPIGQGGQGIVWPAIKKARFYHEEEGRYITAGETEVALKIFLDYSPRALDALMSEANIIAKLQDGNIIQSFPMEMFYFKNLPEKVQAYIKKKDEIERKRTKSKESERNWEKLIMPATVMRLIRGPGFGNEMEALNKHLRNKWNGPHGKGMIERDGRPFKIEYAIPLQPMGFIGSRMARAYEAIHVESVYDENNNLITLVHKDTKPANIMFNQKAELFLTDFALSGLQPSGPNMVVGTPHYMSPEQAFSKEIGPVTDIFLLGLFLYEVWQGRRLQTKYIRSWEKQNKKKINSPGAVAVMKGIYEHDLNEPDRTKHITYLDPKKAQKDIKTSFSQDMSLKLCNLINKCLHPDPRKRAELFKDPEEPESPPATVLRKELEQKIIFSYGYGPTFKAMRTLFNLYEQDFGSVVAYHRHVDEHPEIRSDLSFLCETPDSYPQIARVILRPIKKKEES